MAQKTKVRAAVTLGKRRIQKMTKEEHLAMSSSGGLKGGAARAEALSPDERKKIAQKAAAARWGKKK